jgi:hypothetical protein
MGFGLVIGFIDQLHMVTTSKCNTPNITVTTAHMKSSLASLVISW